MIKKFFTVVLWISSVFMALLAITSAAHSDYIALLGFGLAALTLNPIIRVGVTNMSPATTRVHLYVGTSVMMILSLIIVANGSSAKNRDGIAKTALSTAKTKPKVPTFDELSRSQKKEVSQAWDVHCDKVHDDYEFAKALKYRVDNRSPDESDFIAATLDRNKVEADFEDAKRLLESCKTRVLESIVLK